ncbi:MAG: hypothetical protein OIF34_06370, partial [Porticoccaceae bacterium]|nr:hypothetical protein [Porticoccaceae bacterium]
MDSWHHFLQQQEIDPANTTLLFDLDGITGLQLHNGALDDGSHKLLQGQLTCDLDKLTSTSSLFGAHCTP